MSSSYSLRSRSSTFKATHPPPQWEAHEADIQAAMAREATASQAEASQVPSQVGATVQGAALQASATLPNLLSVPQLPLPSVDPVLQGLFRDKDVMELFIKALYDITTFMGVAKLEGKAEGDTEKSAAAASDSAAAPAPRYTIFRQQVTSWQDALIPKKHILQMLKRQHGGDDTAARRVAESYVFDTQARECYEYTCDECEFNYTLLEQQRRAAGDRKPPVLQYLIDWEDGGESEDGNIFRELEQNPYFAPEFRRFNSAVLDVFVRQSYADPTLLMFPETCRVKLINADGINPDHRGSDHMFVELDYNRSFTLKKNTLGEFVEGMYRIKSHKTDKWYELLFCHVKCVEKKGEITFVLNFDHGS